MNWPHHSVATAAGQGLRDRRRLVGHRLVPGAERARHRVRLLREGLRGRRQLALHERQRDVVRVRVAAHQHLARADGVRDLPDAGRLSGLPAPHRRSPPTSTTTWTTSASATSIRFNTEVTRVEPRRTAAGSVTPRRRRPPALRRGDGGQRPPLEPALARAAVPRRVRRRARCTPTTTRPPRAWRTRTCSCSGSATRPRDIAVETSRVSQHDLPRDAPRRIRDPQVPQGPAHRRARHRADEPPAARVPALHVRSAASRPPRARWRPTACPSRTTSSLEAHPTISSDLLRAHRARPRSP